MNAKLREIYSASPDTNPFAQKAASFFCRSSGKPKPAHCAVRAHDAVTRRFRVAIHAQNRSHVPGSTGSADCARNISVRGDRAFGDVPRGAVHRDG